MAAPLMGVMNQVGGLVFGGQVGQALGTLATEVTSLDRGRPPARPGRCRGVAARGRRPLRRGSRRPARGGPAVPRGPRGGAPPAVRPRPVAARPPARRGPRVRRGDHGRHLAVRGARSQPRPERPRVDAAGDRRGPVRSRPSRPPSRPRWPGSRPRSRSSRAGSTPSRPRRQGATCRASPALQETTRRRRATGGPAERTFASLVGLELRPRRLREAATLWQTLTERRGTDERDAVWSHPDLLPTSDDLDDPAGWVDGGATTPLDLSELEVGRTTTRRRNLRRNLPRSRPRAEPLSPVTRAGWRPSLRGRDRAAGCPPPT